MKISQELRGPKKRTGPAIPCLHQALSSLSCIRICVLECLSISTKIQPQVEKSRTENPKESEKPSTHTHTYSLHRNLSFLFLNVSRLSAPHSNSPFVSPTQPAAPSSRGGGLQPLPEAAPAVWIQPKMKSATKRKSHTRSRSCFPRQKQGTADAYRCTASAGQQDQSAAVNRRGIQNTCIRPLHNSKIDPAIQTEKVPRNPSPAPRFLRRFPETQGSAVAVSPQPKAHNKSPKDHSTPPTASIERVLKTPVSFSARMLRHNVATADRHSMPVWPGFPTCPRRESPWSRK